MLRRGEGYQYLLIGLAGASALLFSLFFIRELFPEYKTYQKAYVALEEFRAKERGEEPPPFRFGIKQIVLPAQDGGPQQIDRCSSCHVALDLAHFSKTTLAKDINGEIQFDQFGAAVQIPNPDYIFTKVKERISDLEKIGTSEALNQAKELYALTAMEGVLAQHPLMGSETRPFQFHPVEEYGCTVCHGGNGLALTAERAHGPVFDGTYEEAFMGPKPDFLESDPENDPPFSKVFNSKPGHRLLFQTTPILVGNLIEANCIKCHAPESPKERQKSLEEKSYSALIALLSMESFLESNGSKQTLNELKSRSQNFDQPKERIEKLQANISYLTKAIDENEGDPEKEKEILAKVREDLLSLVGSKEKLDELKSAFSKNRDLSFEEVKEIFGTETLVEHPIFGKLDHYKLGKELYVSQACYACHRIAGFARGGVGPELSQEGLVYPWFIKESIVWPQADLKTSTMPNFRLDHEEIENLMTFLLAQRPDNLKESEPDKRKRIKDWEEGKKLSFEEPLKAEKIRDVKNSMLIFATEGCASCHRLKGYTSQVKLKNEADREWFRKNFPENALGSELKAALDAKGKELDEKIAFLEEEQILEEMEISHPGLIESFYSPFAYLRRADSDLIYQERVKNLLKLFVTEYGLGRLIGPRPNWSGVFRTDDWLMEHFANPSKLSPKSIMPVFPFDETKFLALTYMLNVLGKENSSALQSEWKARGFSPKVAYERLCAQCHGDELKGNGPVSEWIYPIPKNLTNPIFMRDLTKERASNSIAHGVQGTPMPPWGEVAEGKESTPVLSKSEIDAVVDWLFATLPGKEKISESRKWNYTAEDVVRELNGAEIFDTVPAERGDVEKERFYIKKRFYTENNLAAGKAFFEVNCAVCHGKDADGAGLRAEVMEDAKPRMLINFPWIQSRDDLHLLRSINFGVSGTSMVAWGEATTPLQRLQLVMYIRSLTDEKNELDILDREIKQHYQDKIWNLKSKEGSGEKLQLLKRQSEILKEAGMEILQRYGQGAPWIVYQDLLERMDENNLDLKPLFDALQIELKGTEEAIQIEKGKIKTEETKRTSELLSTNYQRQEEAINTLRSLFAEFKENREKLNGKDDPKL